MPHPVLWVIMYALVTCILGHCCCCCWGGITCLWRLLL